MDKRMYVIDGLEFTRKEVIDFLMTVIEENELYDLAELSNTTDRESIKRRVSNRPLHVAYNIYGQERVTTYTK